MKIRVCIHAVEKVLLLLLLHYVTEIGGCFQILYSGPCIYEAKTSTLCSGIPFQVLVETSSCKHENNNDNSNDNNDGYGIFVEGILHTPVLLRIVKLMVWELKYAAIYRKISKNILPNLMSPLHVLS